MSWTFPNFLSFGRIALVPVFVITLFQGRPARALAVFLLAGLTDLLDGLAARFLDQESRLGAVLDPIADKLLLTTAFVLLTVPGLNPGLTIPAWITVLVIARDVAILVVSVAIFLTVGISSFPPVPLSKVNTAAQIVGVLLVLATSLTDGLEGASLGCLYLVAALTVVTGFQYALRSDRLIEGGSDAKA